MKELALWIRKGLAEKGVKENPFIWCVTVVGERTQASVWGLALIGKLGVNNAISLSRQAVDEWLSKEENSQNLKRIFDELGLKSRSQIEKLIVLHAKNHKSAQQIAQMLEDGQLVL